MAYDQISLAEGLGGSPVFGVSDFIASLNQTLELAYPFVEVQGEILNFRVSKNKWVYFDLKDETASLHCFATVYALPGPLEDGMMVRVAGSPRLHPLYNFSFQVQSIVPVGEGALRRAADLLAAKLEKEGLFDPARKRPLPYPPRHIVLITAADSAAYADFMKITRARWGGLRIDHYDVLVQGEQSPGQLVQALKRANEVMPPPEVIVLIRGGGSADDLAAFSDERVVRAVAVSRVPTLVAIGHEIDLSLAELAADVRASTPSNAAELLVPDKKEEHRYLERLSQQLDELLAGVIAERKRSIRQLREMLDSGLVSALAASVRQLDSMRRLMEAYDPRRPLAQGYAIIHKAGGVVSGVAQLAAGDTIEVTFHDGEVTSEVKSIRKEKP